MQSPFAFIGRSAGPDRARPHVLTSLSSGLRQAPGDRQRDVHHALVVHDGALHLLQPVARARSHPPPHAKFVVWVESPARVIRAGGFAKT